MDWPPMLDNKRRELASTKSKGGEIPSPLVGEG